MKYLFTLVLTLIVSVVFAQTDTLSTDVPSVEVRNINGEKINVQSYASDGKVTILCYLVQALLSRV